MVVFVATPEAKELTTILRASLVAQSGIAPSGALVTGPGGVGKTALVRAVASQLPFNRTVFLPACELLSSQDASAVLRRTLGTAAEQSPALLCLDELHLLDQATARLLAKQLSGTLDGLAPECKLVVVGIAESRRAVPPSLLQTELFEHEVAVAMPDSRQRRDQLLSYSLPSSCELQTSSGQTRRDVCALAQGVLQDRSRADGTEQGAGSSGHVASLDDIAGYVDILAELEELMVWPLVRADAFSKLGVTPPSGLLVHGPTGCGKTVMVQAMAQRHALNFQTIKGPELFSKYVGESEAAVRRIFASARVTAPCVVFFDEVDAIAGDRGAETDSTGSAQRVLSQLLNEMDGIQGLRGVLVVGCTNRPPSELDPAMLRPGRLERRLHVRPPNAADRTAILELLAQTTPVSEDVSLAQLAALTDGFSGAALRGLFRDAAMHAMRREGSSTAGERLLVSNSEFIDALQPPFLPS